MRQGLRLVESIPNDLSDLADAAPSESTTDLLVRLIDAAKTTIDLTAMYWSLQPDPTQPDEVGFTVAQLNKLGADQGQKVFDALVAAAKRGVKIRVLADAGAIGAESDALKAVGQVEVRPVTMPSWYGGGIMHQKLWIVDGRHFYLGSTNNDWRSLAQVKELGVAGEELQPLAEDMRHYFETWWRFAALGPDTEPCFDRDAQIHRRVPSWSSKIPVERRRPSPLEVDAPKAGRFDDDTYVTGCPVELCVNGRVYDGDALVHTIDDAERSVCISVMDFAPISLYSRKPDAAFATQLSTTPVWWPALTDALLHAALTRRVWVRLLVSKWAHTSALIEPLLRALQLNADAGRADSHQAGGTLEIRYFQVPGWDSTTVPSERKYPGHTRVNHAKYIVTDRRANIGTSNMTWDYFASTAGTSFNTKQPQIVRDLQQIFDRDWNSRYAVRLSQS
jgi:phospholipase D3/4